MTTQAATKKTKDPHRTHACIHTQNVDQVRKKCNEQAFDLLYELMDEVVVTEMDIRIIQGDMV